jgi:hypothetical protein
MAEPVIEGKSWFAAACVVAFLLLICLLISPETSQRYLYHFPWLGNFLTWVRRLFGH